MFAAEQIDQATQILELLRSRHLKVTTAESCTGGLIVALLTEIAGSSDVVDRGFVTYTNAAKTEMIGVSEALLAQHGAVSEEVVRAMAAGALTASRADVAIAVTGVAGPAGGTEAKPVGLVYVAAAWRRGGGLVQECRFGAVGRGEIRRRATAEAIELVRRLIS